MGIVQERIESADKDVKLLKFEELKHEPFVQMPESIDGITGEWFCLQKERIEKSIARYEQSDISRDSKQRITRRMRNRIERLRKFTEDVLSSRDSVHRDSTVNTPQPDINENITEPYDRRVDMMIEKKRRDETLGLWLKSCK